MGAQTTTSVPASVSAAPIWAWGPQVAAVGDLPFVGGLDQQAAWRRSSAVGLGKTATTSVPRLSSLLTRSIEG